MHKTYSETCCGMVTKNWRYAGIRTECMHTPCRVWFWLSSCLEILYTYLWKLFWGLSWVIFGHSCKKEHQSRWNSDVNGKYFPTNREKCVTISTLHYRFSVFMSKWLVKYVWVRVKIYFEEQCQSHTLEERRKIKREKQSQFKEQSADFCFTTHAKRSAISSE